MKQYIVKAEISNNVNDGINIEWFASDDEAEILRFKNEKEEEVNRWNYHTPGAISIRSVYFSNYQANQIKECTLEEFSTMKLKDFLQLILT
jgi:hypothetical protein